MPQQNNNEPIYDKFYGYLGELLQSYTKLGELLTRKLAAIAAFDVAALDDIIKEEQVFVLLARGFDNNMNIYRQKLALAGDSLSAVIPQMPEEERARFTSLRARLKAKLDDVKAMNEKCQGLIEERIYSLERAIRSIDKTKKPNTYNSSATGPRPGMNADPHFLRKQV
jgi:flagellar biosynthesis/type III secretory pathway chaperone